MTNNSEIKKVYSKPEIKTIEMELNSDILSVSTEWATEYDLDE